MDDLHHHGSEGRNEMLATYESFFYLRNKGIAKDQGSLFGEFLEKDIDRPDREIKTWTARNRSRRKNKR